MGHDVYVVKVDDAANREHYTRKSGSGLRGQAEAHVYWTFNYNPAVLNVGLMKLLHSHTGSEVAAVLVRVATKMLEAGVTLDDVPERFVESHKTNEWNWMWGIRLTDKQKEARDKHRKALEFTDAEYDEARKNDAKMDAEFQQSVSLWKIMTQLLPTARQYPSHYWFSDQVWLDAPIELSDEHFVSTSGASGTSVSA
jgi:hypothetical protein